MDAAVLLHLAIALGLGLLVGLQREWATDEVAGIRTFALLTLLGFVSAVLADPLAIVFGLLYAAVLVGVAAAKEHFGQGALYAVAALSGLTDMDAITLSTAPLVRSGRLDPATGWRLILIGAMGNLVFKGVAAAVLGHRRLIAQIAPAFGVSLVGGALLLALWP